MPPRPGVAASVPPRSGVATEVLVLGPQRSGIPLSCPQPPRSLVSLSRWAVCGSKCWHDCRQAG
eukprot:664313-Rhodomonas_salina.1